MPKRVWVVVSKEDLTTGATIVGVYETESLAKKIRDEIEKEHNLLDHEKVIIEQWPLESK